MARKHLFDAHGARRCSVRLALARSRRRGAVGRAVLQRPHHHFLVASQPGGVNDLVARLISRHLGNHIPGKPTVIVQNLQAAGLVLANRIYDSAEKDGTVIAIIERGTPQLAIQGEPNAHFDPLKMTWLGSVSSYADDAYVFWVNSSFAAKTVADLKPPSTLDRARSAPPAPARPTSSSRIFPRTCSASTCRTCAAIAARPMRSWRSSAARSTARSWDLSAIKVGQTSLYDAGSFRPLIPFARTTRSANFPMCRPGASLPRIQRRRRCSHFAEAPFFMALPVVAPPDVPADRAKALQTGVHGDDQGSGLRRRNQEDEPGPEPDRRRGGAQHHRGDERDAEGRDRAVQRDRALKR